MQLEKAKIKQSFSQAAITYDSVARLQRQIGQDLLRIHALDALHGRVLDVGCGTGFLTGQLLPHCQNATVFALDLAPAMLAQCRQKVATQAIYLCADAEKLPLQAGTIDTLFSNVALQWCYPLDRALSELRCVLKPEGRLVFSTFGHQTLYELKAAWTQVDDFAHVNDFYTYAALQNSLEQAGFVEITVTTRRYVQTYASVLDLMHELKQIGAHNVSDARSKTLTTKAALKTLISAYPKNAAGEVAATFEVFYVLARRASY